MIQLELFEDIDKDFRTMKQKIKGDDTRYSRVIQAECWVVEMYENNVLVETRELPGKSVHYANDCAENWDSGLIRRHYLDDFIGGVG